MPVKFEDLRYPAELTNSAWQKAKGKLGRTVKSGLGPELARAEALFKQINLNLVDLDKGTIKSDADLDARVKVAQTEHAQRIQPLCEQWRVISVAAEVAEHELRKNLLGKDAAKAARKIGVLAEKYSKDWSRLNLVEQVAKLSVEITRAKARDRGQLEKLVAELVVLGRKFLGKPDLETWNREIVFCLRKLASVVRDNEVLQTRFGRQLDAVISTKPEKLGLSAGSTEQEIASAMRDPLKKAMQLAKELVSK